MPDLFEESSSCTMPPLLTAASSTNYLESIQDVNKQSTENIAEQFEELLEHFQASGAASKYSLLATDLVTSAGRILDVRIRDIKSYSKSLNVSIDLCYTGFDLAIFLNHFPIFQVPIFQVLLLDFPIFQV